MYKLIILDEALEEWSEVAAYYESKERGLGMRFTSAMEESLILIESEPQQFQKVKKEYRQYLVKPFPFLIVFRIDKPLMQVVVTSIFHSKRNPKKKFRK